MLQMLGDSDLTPAIRWPASVPPSDAVECGRISRQGHLHELIQFACRNRGIGRRGTRYSRPEEITQGFRSRPDPPLLQLRLQLAAQLP
jgi:hypothetical protein